MILGCKCKLKQAGFRYFWFPGVFFYIFRYSSWYFPYLWCFSWGSGLAKWGHCGRFLLGRKAGLPLRHGHNQTASMIANAQRKQKKEVSSHTSLSSFERELLPFVHKTCRMGVVYFWKKTWLILVLMEFHHDEVWLEGNAEFHKRGS